MELLGGSSVLGLCFRGFAKLKKFKKSQKNWKWVGGSRSHLDKKKLENRPKRKF